LSDKFGNPAHEDIWYNLRRLEIEFIKLDDN
jgi:hypothetical protein